jgi:hypothetical protein
MSRELQEVEDPVILREQSRENGNFVSATHRLPLPHGRFLVLIMLEDELTPESQLGRKTSSGIEPVTIVFVMQMLQPTAVPRDLFYFV